MAIYDLYKNMKSKRDIVFFKTAKNYHAFNEDAVFLASAMGWRLELLGKDTPYLKLTFSTSYFKGVQLKVLNEFRIGIKVFEVGHDETIKGIPVVMLPKNAIGKHEYVSDVDVRHKMEQLENSMEEFTTARIKKIKSGNEQSFLLHKKAKNLSRWIFLSVGRYMPKNFRTSLGASLISEWTELIREINKIRNVPAHLKTKETAFTTYSEILSKCSIHIDTLKDYAEAVFHVGGWKNFKQYRFVLLRLSEIGKIAQGILSAAAKRYLSASAVA